MATKQPVRIAEQIARDFIRSGAVRVGGKLPSIRALQRRYGSSNTTIGHALNILEARGEITAVQGKGCFITDQTHQSPNAATDAIGLVSPFHAAHELAGRLTEGVEWACQRHGRHMQVATSHSYGNEQEAIQRLIEGGCSGVVVWPVTRRKQELNNDYLNREFKDVPIVLFDIAYPEQKRSQVVFDNYRAAFQMTEFLINEGHRRIAFMDLACAEGEYLQRSTRDRYEGYLDALSAWKLTARPDDRWIIDVRERMDLAFDGFMDQHMMGSDRPTALIAIEDTAALYAIHAATERGLRVPNDLRVVGFDNLRACRAVRPPFPTSDPSFRLAGEVAVDLVVREIRGQVKPPVVYMLPVPLLLTGEQRAVSYADNIGAGQHLTPSPTLFADKTQGNKEKAMHGKAVSVE